MVNEKKIIITPEGLIRAGIVAIKLEGNENIVFAVSKDEKYVRDMQKMLWDRQSDFPFADVHIDYKPNLNPGYRGTYYLIVTNPSPELVALIQPSPEGPHRYDHLKDQKPEDIVLLIGELRKQGKNIKQIAEELDVFVSDIELWSFYMEETEIFHKEIEKEAEELRKKLKS